MEKIASNEVELLSVLRWSNDIVMEMSEELRAVLGVIFSVDDEVVFIDCV